MAVPRQGAGRFSGQTGAWGLPAGAWGGHTGARAPPTSAHNGNSIRTGATRLPSRHRPSQTNSAMRRIYHALRHPSRTGFRGSSPAERLDESGQRHVKSGQRLEPSGRRGRLHARWAAAHGRSLRRPSPRIRDSRPDSVTGSIPSSSPRSSSSSSSRLGVRQGARSGLERIPHSGMFPCLRGRFSCRLPASISRARTSLPRVCSGRITSST